MNLPSFQICDADLSEEMVSLYSRDPVLAVDTETMGLLPHRDRLCVVQISNASEQVCVLRIPQGLREAPRLKALLESATVEKVFHFARFDMAMLKAHLGIQVGPVFCTKIASKLARTYTNKHGLKDVVQELCQVELNKSAQSSDWGAVYELSPEQLAYAANDVRYLIAARARLQAMLEREERWELAQQCFAHLPTLVSLDLRGYSHIFEHQ
ncbi:MAG: ribonuclease D [Synechococcaceae cyanobacterium SM2_3_1]|nr:ribonuclease D [Synechococcaceae cyanobacterium SM2_3_1]